MKTIDYWDHDRSKNMNIKYGIPVIFICCGVFVILINILGSRSNFKEPKPYLGNILFKKEVSRTLLDLKNFKYEISPKCVSTSLMWIITSYAGDDSKRSALRRAYNSQELDQLGIQRVFLLGKLDDFSQKKTGITQEAIKDESRRFNDIVQGNFFEAYRNLTYKHVMGLKWTIENCNNITYIMKMDDDIIINLYEILNLIQNRNINDSIAGYVFENTKPKREPANKWFVTKNEFDQEFYPTFVSGWLYVTTYQTALKLINELESYHKYFWIDDIFVTGILREKAEIGLVNIQEIYTTDFGFLKCCIESGKKGFRCEFAVGPDGGDTNLQIRFKQFTNICRFKCKPKSIGKSCVLTFKERSLGKGNARIYPINIL